MILDLVVNWLVAAVALYIVAKVISGFEIRGFGEALVAAAVIGLVDMTLGPVLRFISFPDNLSDARAVPIRDLRGGSQGRGFVLSGLSDFRIHPGPGGRRGARRSQVDSSIRGVLLNG